LLHSRLVSGAYSIGPMGTLPMEPPCDMLTTEHVRSTAFQKLDKDVLVRNYVHGQKSHSKAYAVEGHAVFSSWDSRTPEKNAEDLTADTGFGFDTPVLKPRVVKPPARDCHRSAGEGDEGDQHCTESIREQPTYSKRQMNKEKNKTRTKRPPSKTSTSKQLSTSSPTVRAKPVPPAPAKRKVSADMDEEYIARKILYQFTTIC
jgi:hypothetical protein